MCSVYKGTVIKEQDQQEKWIYIIRKHHIHIMCDEYSFELCSFVCSFFEENVKMNDSVLRAKSVHRT